MSSTRASLEQLHRRIVRCRACPRLVAWRELVAKQKRRAYRDETYWGRPVPGFGDPRARLVIVGLAPGAHGANRTGRLFTGDRSGDFLFAGLHRAGFANQPASVSRDDGLQLRDAFISAPVRCAPPDNWPTREEVLRCRPFFLGELSLLRPLVILALGQLAWDETLSALEWPRGPGAPRPKFAHGAWVEPPDGKIRLAGCYHVSQQNTSTGRLTPAMFDAVLHRITTFLDAAPLKSR